MPSTKNWNSKENFADQVNAFNKKLEFKGKLPDDIRIMNPFRENPQALTTSARFYKKFYEDQRERSLILGINPGRHGAGVTGVPFNDTKRLESRCGLKIEGANTHEPSSVFVYEMIDAYGGVEIFYRDFYITSICPLGFVRRKENGREVNYNYYDSKELTHSVRPFIEKTLREQLDFGIRRDVCFVLGRGKNFKFMKTLNTELTLFDRLEALEHPRYVMQYKFKEKETYLNKFVNLLQASTKT